MNLSQFCENLFKEDGFILIDANSKEYVIGEPKKNPPIKLTILDKKLHYKLLFLPDLYFGEAYTDGSIKIENGELLRGILFVVFKFRFCIVNQNPLHVIKRLFGFL